MRFFRAGRTLCLLAALSVLATALPLPAAMPGTLHLAPSSMTKNGRSRLMYWLRILQETFRKYTGENSGLSIAEQENVLAFLQRELKDAEWSQTGRMTGVSGLRRVNVEVQGKHFLLLEKFGKWIPIPWLSEDPEEDYGSNMVGGADISAPWKKIVAAGRIPSLAVTDAGSIAYRTMEDASGRHITAVDEKLLGPWRIRVNKHRGLRAAAMDVLGPHRRVDCHFCKLFAAGRLQEEVVKEIPVGSAGRSWIAVYNLTPFATGAHLIWLPKISADILDAREQKMTLQDYEDIMSIAGSESSENHLMIINDLLGGSQNHIHTQSIYFPDDIPLGVELAAWAQDKPWRGFPLEYGLDYPAAVLRIRADSVGRKMAARIAFALEEAYARRGAYLAKGLRKGVLYLFPRRKAVSGHLPGIKIGALEEMGLFIMTDREQHFANLVEEAQIERVLADVSLDRGRAHRIMRSVMDNPLMYGARKKQWEQVADTVEGSL